MKRYKYQELASSEYEKMLYGMINSPGLKRQSKILERAADELQ